MNVIAGFVRIKGALRRAAKAYPSSASLPLVGPILRDLRHEDSDAAASQRMVRLKRQIVGIQDQIERTLFFHRFAPAKFVGGAALNRLGLQPVRVAWLNRRHAARPEHQIATGLEESYRTLCDDGVVAIPNFLPLDVFAAVRREFETVLLQGTKDLKYCVIQETDVEYARQVVPSKVIVQALSENAMLRELVSAAARSRIAVKPAIYLLEACAPVAGGTHGDGQDVLHCDVPYPSFKAFLYITDVTAGNGAFTYAKGTHRLTPERLRLERAMSVRYYERIAAEIFNPEPLAEAERRALGVVETPMIGPANTLVVFNVMGFHRRGGFTGPDGLRQVVQLNFRTIDAPLNRLAVHFKRTTAS